MPKSLLYSLFSLLFLLILSACSPNDLPGVVTITPPLPTAGAWTVTPFTVNPSLPSATLASTAIPGIATATMPVTEAASTPTAGASPTALPTDVASSSLRPLYAIDANMDYAAKSVDVTQEITWHNQTGESLSQIILAVEPNLLPDVFNLASVAVDGQKIDSFTLDGQKLEVTLPAALAAGATLKLGFAYTLTLPIIEQGDPNEVRPKIFGVAERQVNLVDWYPFVVPYIPGTGWVLHEPWYYGEHLVYEKADFDVTLHINNSADSALGDGQALPIVAASALGEPISDGKHYRFENARDFSLSLGRKFKVISQQIEGGITVSSYYLGVENESAAKAALDTTIKAVKTYSELFGPYPHKMLTVVQGDFNDGMEFDGLYFLPNSFYNLYDGTEKNYQVIIAAHETAHQWWFGRVANDQAQEPWLDESLATYCERIFYEKNYPDDVKWWWDYRIAFYQPVGTADTVLYNGGGFRPYTNAVYFMGATFLEDLRKQIGDETFFAFLKDYASEMDGKISTSADFFRILRAHTSEDISPLLTKYFQDTH